MGLLDKLFGKKEAPELEVGAPLAGEVVPVGQVNDPTFADEILGKGIAIRPTGNKVYAPCDGTIGMMFDTGHAVSMTSTEGTEILIHVGLETVGLNGKYYTVHAANGDEVKKGQLLIEFDREAIAAEGYDTITPVVICNSMDYSEVKTFTGKTVEPGEKVVALVK